MNSLLHLQIVRPKTLLILNVNAMSCYFPHFVVWHGNARMFGRNIDKNKVEVKIWMEHLFSQVFKYFYIAIWSYMKLEDVLEVLPMLIFETFLEQFVFIWGHEQCSKMFGQIYPRSYYYLKDLKKMYYNCHELPCGKEDQTILIDDEPSKAFQNLKWSGFFLESFEGQMLSKNKVQWLDLASHF